MPRKYLRKRPKMWTSDDIKNAVNELNANKKSSSSLAKKYGIPVATLRRYSKLKIEVGGFHLFFRLAHTLLR